MNSAGQAQASLWQHPFVDLFKYVTLNEWKLASKEGDVTEILDKTTARKSFKITGSISASNYIQIPKAKSSVKSLGLTGRFVYIELQVPVKKMFSIHLDFQVTGRNIIRFSVSNLFKEVKNQNNSILQIPCQPSKKWTVVCLDIPKFLTQYKLMAPNVEAAGSHTLRSVQICSNLTIRSIYTSDNHYNPDSLPREMQFKCGKNDKWTTIYNWHNAPTNEEENKENLKFGVGYKKGGGGGKRPTSGIKKKKQPNSPLKEQKPRDDNADDDDDGERQEADYGASPLGNTGILDRLTASGGHAMAENKLADEVYTIQQPRREMAEKRRVGKEVDVGVDEEIVKEELAEVKAKQSALVPDPIVRLKHVIGYSGALAAGDPSALWYHAENEKSLIFPSGSTLIAMDVNTMEQRFFFGHSAAINSLTMTDDGKYIASGQTGKSPIVRFWETSTGRCIGAITLPMNEVKTLAFSYSGEYFATSGKDSHSRQLIMVWSIAGMEQGRAPEMIARQLSDFDIQCLKFSPVDSSRLASCGRENIRFWRIKNGHLPGCAVVLNHHARDSVFTCLDFESSTTSSEPISNEKMKLVYVGSAHGMLYQVNYRSRELEGVYQIHDGAIMSVAVNEGFCVTGSADKYLRVWPLDFSEFYLEAQHEGDVSSVKISPDGLQIACGTSNGSLGILDVASQEYRSVLRSHVGDILDIAIHKATQNVFTISKDTTIRVWNKKTHEQLYEFTSPDDQAISIDVHPAAPFFACGFITGSLRVFDLEKTCVFEEFRQHETPVISAKFSPDGRFLLTTSVDSVTCVHDVARNYQPVKMIYTDFAGSYAHSCWSPDGTVFATIAQNSAQVRVWDSKTFVLKNKIDLQNALAYKIQFSPDQSNLVVVTSESKLQYYSLKSFEGEYVKQIPALHRGECRSLDVSPATKYIVSGGTDRMVKIWKYDQKAVGGSLPPYQTFIGHSTVVNKVAFALDGSEIYSAGSGDGLLIWDFLGDDTKQTFDPITGSPLMETRPAQKRDTACFTPEESVNLRDKIGEPSPQSLVTASASKFANQDTFGQESEDEGVQVVDQLEGSDFREIFDIDCVGGTPDNLVETQKFCSTAFTAVQVNNEDLSRPDRDLHRDEEEIEIRSRYNLPIKHCVGLKTADNATGQETRTVSPRGGEKQLALRRILGYNGRAHDNIVWDEANGYMIYTISKTIIIESLKGDCSQSYLIGHNQAISTLALSPDGSVLASGAAGTDESDGAVIKLWNPITKMELKTLKFHQAAIQSLAFSQCGKYLVSVGNYQDNTIAVWDLATGAIAGHSALDSPVHSVKVNTESDSLEFVSIQSDRVTVWKLTGSSLIADSIELPESFNPTCQQVTAIAFTAPLASGFPALLVGTSSGTIWTFDLATHSFYSEHACLNGEIGLINFAKNRIIVGGQSDHINSWKIPSFETVSDPRLIFLSKNPDILLLDASAVAQAFDEKGTEGLIGTCLGTIWYINWEERATFRLVSGHYSPGPITSVDWENADKDSIFSSASHDGTLRVWSSKSCDQVMQFQTESAQCVLVKYHPMERRAVASYSDGYIRFFNLERACIDGKSHVMTAQDHITCLEFDTESDNTALVGTKNGCLAFVKIESWEPLSVKRANAAEIGSSISSVDFNRIMGGVYWLASNENGEVYVFKNIKGRDNGRVNFFLQDCNHIMNNPHGETIDDADASIRHTQNLFKYSKGPSYAKFSPIDGEVYLSIVLNLQYVIFRNFSTHETLQRVALNHFPTTLAVCPHGQTYVVGTQDNLVELFDFETHSIQDFKGHSSAVTSLAFSADGKQILSGAGEEVFLWSLD